jgi:DNA-binding NarL/FixJ family response regulator
MAAGVQGYGLKAEGLNALVRAIEAVLRGERYISPDVQVDGPGSGDHHALSRLSRREREVLCLLADGRTSKEVARALCVSVRTVDAHRLHINRKLAIRTPTQLARYVADAGLMARRRLVTPPGGAPNP